MTANALGEWRVHVSPDKAEPVILDTEDRPVATVHGTNDEEVLRRALLIARAPTLRDAARACHMVFRTNSWCHVSMAPNHRRCSV